MEEKQKDRKAQAEKDQKERRKREIKRKRKKVSVEGNSLRNWGKGYRARPVREKTKMEDERK